MGALEEHLTLSWEGKLIAECTREELIECIEFLTDRNKVLRAARRERSMAGIVPAPPLRGTIPLYEEL